MYDLLELRGADKRPSLFINFYMGHNIVSSPKMYVRSEKIQTICAVFTVLSFNISPRTESKHMWLWYLSHMGPAKAQVRQRIWADSPAHSHFVQMQNRTRQSFSTSIWHHVQVDGWVCAFVNCLIGGLKVPLSRVTALCGYTLELQQCKLLAN